MNKELLNIVSKFEGTVIAIDIDDKLITSLDNNSKVTKFDLLTSIPHSKKFVKGSQRPKKISNKKLRKIFKKKKTAYMICNYESIKKILNTFVRDSIYINNNKLYIFGEIEIDDVLKRYKRYNVKIDLKQKKDYLILEIDNTLSKNKRFKELGYRIVDGFNKVIEVIGDVLMN